jgi:hypothetical protein
MYLSASLLSYSCDSVPCDTNSVNLDVREVSPTVLDVVDSNIGKAITVPHEELVQHGAVLEEGIDGTISHSRVTEIDADQVRAVPSCTDHLNMSINPHPHHSMCENSDHVR